MSVFRRRSRCWLIDMASSRKKPARRRSRWESLYAVMWFMNSFSGRSGRAFKLDMHAKWRCMPLTWPIGLRVPGASWVFVFFLFFRLFIYYIYIYLKAWRSDGDYVPCQVSPDNASEAMHSTCCSRRLEDIYPSAHTLFFSLFQFSPYLQSPPFWRALQLLKVLHLVDRRSMWVRWSSGILNGHVLRRVGVQCHNYICYLSLIFENSCMQDEAAMDVISPSSSASEKEPIKDSNQCQPFLERKKQGQVYIIINLFLFESEDVSPLQPSTSASARDKAHWQSCRARSMMNLPHRIQYAL